LAVANNPSADTVPERGIFVFGDYLPVVANDLTDVFIGVVEILIVPVSHPPIIRVCRPLWNSGKADESLKVCGTEGFVQAQKKHHVKSMVQRI